MNSKFRKESSAQGPPRTIHPVNLQLARQPARAASVADLQEELERLNSKLQRRNEKYRHLKNGVRKLEHKVMVGQCKNIMQSLGLRRAEEKMEEDTIETLRRINTQLINELEALRIQIAATQKKYLALMRSNAFPNLEAINCIPYTHHFSLPDYTLLGKDFALYTNGKKEEINKDKQQADEKKFHYQFFKNQASEYRRQIQNFKLRLQLQQIEHVKPNLQCQNLLQQLQHSKHKNAELIAKINTYQNELTATKLQYEQLKNSSNQCQKQLESTSLQTAELNKKVNSQQMIIEQFKSQTDNLNIQLTQLKGQIAIKSNSQQKYVKQIQRISSELNNKLSQLQQFRKAVDDQKYMAVSLNQENIRLKQQLNKMHQQIQQLSSKFQSSQIEKCKYVKQRQKIMQQLNLSQEYLTQIQNLKKQVCQLEQNNLAKSTLIQEKQIQIKGEQTAKLQLAQQYSRVQLELAQLKSVKLVLEQELNRKNCYLNQILEEATLSKTLQQYIVQQGIQTQAIGLARLHQYQISIQSTEEGLKGQVSALREEKESLQSEVRQLRYSLADPISILNEGEPQKFGTLADLTKVLQPYQEQQHREELEQSKKEVARLKEEVFDSNQLVNYYKFSYEKLENQLAETIRQKKMGELDSRQAAEYQKKYLKDIIDYKKQIKELELKLQEASTRQARLQEEVGRYQMDLDDCRELIQVQKQKIALLAKSPERNPQETKAECNNEVPEQVKDLQLQQLIQGLENKSASKEDEYSGFDRDEFRAQLVQKDEQIYCLEEFKRSLYQQLKEQEEKVKDLRLKLGQLNAAKQLLEHIERHFAMLVGELDQKRLNKRQLQCMQILNSLLSKKKGL